MLRCTAMHLLFLQNWAGMRKGGCMIAVSPHLRALLLGLCVISAPLLSGCDMLGGGQDAATLTKVDASDIEAGTISDDMIVLDDSAVDGTAVDNSAPTPLPGTGPALPKPATAAADPAKAADPAPDGTAPMQPSAASGPASPPAPAPAKAPAKAPASAPAAPKARTLDQVAKSAADAAKAPPKIAPKAAPKAAPKTP
jgi:hypothetical protein